jgi:hypothetical protein
MLLAASEALAKAGSGGCVSRNSGEQSPRRLGFGGSPKPTLVGIGSRETRELIRKASDAVLNQTHYVAADLQPA